MAEIYSNTGIVKLFSPVAMLNYSNQSILRTEFLIMRDPDNSERSYREGISKINSTARLNISYRGTSSVVNAGKKSHQFLNYRIPLLKYLLELISLFLLMLLLRREPYHHCLREKP